MTDPTPQATHTRDEAVPDDIVRRVADAIDKAEVGYHLRLTKMADGENTYTLTYADGEEHEFDDIDDGYAHIRQRKLRSQAAYVIEALASAPAPASGSEAGPVAWCDVLAERRRQVEAEGWTAAHDDEHGNGEMARAASSYALEHAAWTYTETPSARLMDAARAVWPWGKEWWKPCAGRRMLVKAAALILAEIERIDRKEGVR